MAAPKRPSLSHLAVQKPAPAAAAVAAPEAAGAEVSAAPTLTNSAATPRSPVPRRSPPDMKTVQVRINKRGWSALRNLASERDLSLEALMVEALNDVLLKHQQPPIVERRTGERGTEGAEGE